MDHQNQTPFFGYTSREDALIGCQNETANARQFLRSAEAVMDTNHIGKAIRMVESAHTFAVCAMQAHEALWELSGGELSEEEFIAFEQAEIVQTELWAVGGRLREKIKMRNSIK